MNPERQSIGVQGTIRGERIAVPGGGFVFVLREFVAADGETFDLRGARKSEPVYAVPRRLFRRRIPDARVAR